MKVTDNKIQANSWAGIAVSATLFLAFFASISYGQDANSRRQLFNDGWRFTRNDPSGAEAILAWDKVKDWVTATGNEYVVDGAKPTRPAGNIGEDVPYTRSNFDDSSWRQLNLPHDWGIEGDFQQELPDDTGKRPWAGVGWYRKHFRLDEADKDKQPSRSITAMRLTLNLSSRPIAGHTTAWR